MVQLDPILPGMGPQPVGLRLQLRFLLVAGNPGVADGAQRRLFVREYHVPEATVNGLGIGVLTLVVMHNVFEIDQKCRCPVILG